MKKKPVKNNNDYRDKIKEETKNQWAWFQAKLLEVRKELGLSQTQLADRLGVRKARISHMERIETDCTFSMAFRIIKALELNPAEFFADCPNFYTRRS